MYSIPCSCGKVYIGQTGRHISTRIKEHMRDTRDRQGDRSAVAEHRMETGHIIKFEEAQMLSREARFWPRLYKEAIEIQKNPHNYNRDRGIDLPGIWKPVMRNNAHASVTRTSINTRAG